MNRVLLLLLPLAAGCLPVPSPKPPPEPPDPNRPEVTVRLDPQAVTFADPAVTEAFRKLDAAARKLARPDWVVRNAGTYSSEDPNDQWGNAGDYVGWWSLRPVPDGAYDPSPRPKHQIKLQVSARNGAAGSFSLLADRDPEHGWGAWVWMSRTTGPLGPVDGFVFTVHHPEHLPRPDPGQNRVRFGGGSQEVCVRRSDDRHEYTLEASSRRPGGEAERRPAGEGLRTYWASAESFRDAALADLDRLVDRLRTPAGRSYRVVPRGKPPSDPAAVRAIWREPPEPYKSEMIAAALAEVEARKALVRDHFRDMHAAVVAAFPELADILDPAK